MNFPIIELVDRYAVAVVKHKKTNGANKVELEFYEGQMKVINLNPYHQLVQQLIEHHEYVWSLEDDFKKGRIDDKPLAEIGRIAMMVRDQGYVRTGLKNKIAELLDDPVREVKQYGKE